eukprot:TRINITY_DN2649_c0_g1_i2.p1 TRINITY_DN2649_c0_g1~~TRINITY_DN2649_c0_g1_i2.p1  ORF type:complete len:105 (-),score=21.79 TRINITY_DN2649_c0_g1_i2:65-379(-)
MEGVSTYTYSISYRKEEGGSFVVEKRRIIRKREYKTLMRQRRKDVERVKVIKKSFIFPLPNFRFEHLEGATQMSWFMFVGNLCRPKQRSQITNPTSANLERSDR